MNGKDFEKLSVLKKKKVFLEVKNPGDNEDKINKLQEKKREKAANWKPIFFFLFNLKLNGKAKNLGGENYAKSGVIKEEDPHCKESNNSFSNKKFRRSRRRKEKKIKGKAVKNFLFSLHFSCNFLWRQNFNYSIRNVRGKALK